MRKLIMLSCACLLVCSCALTSARPDVSLADLRFGDVSFMETSLVATLRYENEGSQPLAIEGGVHKIFLNGIYIGKGMSDQPIEVPRLGSATQTVTFHINNLTMLPKIQRLVEARDFHYEIDSLIYSRGGLGLPARVRVKSEGRYDLFPDARVN